jgi:rRNA maturation RNase YbeY
LTTDDDIARLNQGYLGRDGATNVLAFPMSGGPPPQVESRMLGDVVVSLDTALKESAACGEPLHQTINRLLIHGVLHLLGYDHERSASDARRMKAAERRLMAEVEEET